MSIFGFYDESDRGAGFQAGLYRRDGTPRPSLNAFRDAIAAGCFGRRTSWSPARSVVGAHAKFSDSSPKPAKQTAWSVGLTASEDATAKVGLFRLTHQSGRRCTPGRVDFRRIFSGKGSPSHELIFAGEFRLKANLTPVLRLGKGTLGPGCYFYAAVLTAVLNGDRQTTFASKGFRAGNPVQPGPGLCYNHRRVRDPRLDRLGELIAGYSLDLQPGEVVRIEGADVAEPLLYSLYRAALRRGANPYLQVGMDRLSELKVAEGSDEQIAYVSQLEWDELEQLDAVATVWAERNTRSFTNADSERYGRYLSARRELSKRGWERIAAGELRWCGTLHPSTRTPRTPRCRSRSTRTSSTGPATSPGRTIPSSTGAASRSSCSSTQSGSGRCGSCESSARTPTSRSALPAGRGRRPTAARTCPTARSSRARVEAETRGEIRFGFPASSRGARSPMCGSASRVGGWSRAEASRGGDFLRSLLEMDGGAAVLGELAFGLNYEIDRFTRNILFDEKIGGTIHVALGSSFSELGGLNDSKLHWDLICDLRAEGEVYADGELSGSREVPRWLTRASSGSRPCSSATRRTSSRVRSSRSKARSWRRRCSSRSIERSSAPAATRCPS